VLGTALAAAGVGAIRLLFAASVVGGLATPIGLALLTLVAANPALTRRRPASLPLRVAGWAVTALITVVSGVYLVQQLHP
jgi:Mn2+/Fe2+ NRAMP family transporter